MEQLIYFSSLSNYGWLFYRMVDDLKKSKKTVVQPINIKDFIEKDKIFEILESIENFPKSIVRFYKKMRGFQFWWHGLNDEFDISVLKSHINILGLDEALKQLFFKGWTFEKDFDFGGEGWSLDDKNLDISGDFDFYPLKKSDEEIGIGYFTGSRCDDCLYHFNYKTITSLKLNLDGYLLLMSKTCDFKNWEELLIEPRKKQLLLYHKTITKFIQFANKDFRIWELEELYRRVKIN